MRHVIVCGSRRWQPGGWGDVAKVLQDQHTQWPISVLVHGACPNSPDTWAAEWAERVGGIEVIPFPADWNGLGKRAGRVRNTAMARAGAHLCIAFWDGQSRGTKHMIEEATFHSIPTIIIPGVT